jgi:hypothetical protein
VLLASPAGGADATSQIGEDLNLSISLYSAPAPSRGYLFWKQPNSQTLRYLARLAEHGRASVLRTTRKPGDGCPGRWCRGELAHDAKGRSVCPMSDSAMKRCGLGALLMASYEITRDHRAA